MNITLDLTCNDVSDTEEVADQVAEDSHELGPVSDFCSMVGDFWSLVDAPDGAEEEEQQGARAEEVSASGGRVLRSSKVCETPTPHNEAAGRHVRWQDTSVFER